MNKLARTLFAVTALWNLAFADDTFVEVVEETDAYRLVQHLSGETQVPLDPKRVVSLRPHLTDTLLALGVTPAGAATWNNEHPEYLAETLAGVALVGSPDTPSLEAILALEPDLIVTPPYEPDLYPQLSRIAPTVVLDWKTDWRDDVRDMGVVLGREEAAQEIVAAYDEKVAGARERLEQTVGDESVMFLRARDKDLIYYGSETHVGLVLYTDLGLTPFTGMTEAFESFSMEILPELDPDHIFFVVNSGAEAEALARDLQESSLWSGLEAVQQGNVYPVDFESWVNGYAPLARSQNVDDVLAALAGDTP